MRKKAVFVSVALAASVAFSAAPASADATGTVASANGLADCTYQVTRTVEVYEKPTNISKHLTTKHKGDRVRGFSHLTHYNEREHVHYRAVDTTKARDDIGWLDATAVKLIRCDR